MKTILCLLFALILYVPAFDLSQYGAGEMLEPGKTYQVNPTMTWGAIRTIAAKLQPGDTLEFADGIYTVNYEMAFNVHDNDEKAPQQCGRPGAPIRLAAAPGAKPILRGADYFARQDGEAGQLAEFTIEKQPFGDTIFEYPSHLQLQRVGSEELVRDYAGTYWRDDKSGRTLVHFAALGQQGVLSQLTRVGLRIHGSWFLVEGLSFENLSDAFYLRNNRPFDKTSAEHITVRNCGFYHNSHCGLLADGPSHSLFTLNHAADNPGRGNALTLSHAHHNLIIRNYFGPCPETLRNHRPNETNFAYNHYNGGDTARENHLYLNVMDFHNAMRWKPAPPDSIVRNNLLLGRFWAESAPTPALFEANCITEAYGWMGVGYTVNSDEGFAKTPMKFTGTLRNADEFRKAVPEITEVEALRHPAPAIQFPPVLFQSARTDFILEDSATVFFDTPDNDGWGSVGYRKKGQKKMQWTQGALQGSRHHLTLSNLSPDTEYEWQPSFKGRWGNSGTGQVFSFRTAPQRRAPTTLEVAPGGMTLAEAACAAIPGDLIHVAPGRYTELFHLQHSGTKDAPIVLKAEKGAVLDGMGFNGKLVDLVHVSHVVIDGLAFENIELNTHKSVIHCVGGEDITIRNCSNYRLHWQSGNFLNAVGVKGLLVENNIIHGGSYPIETADVSDLTLRGNTIVDAVMISVCLWSPKGKTTIRGNIFYRSCIDDKRNTAFLFHDLKGTLDSDENFFGSPIPEHPVGGTFRDANAKVLSKSTTLAEWQAISKGQDLHSLTGDPQFEDYKHQNFTLKSTSPAKGKGARY